MEKGLTSAGGQCCLIVCKFQDFSNNRSKCGESSCAYTWWCWCSKSFESRGDPSGRCLWKYFSFSTGLYFPSRTIRVWDQDLAPFPCWARLLALRRACLSALLYKSFQRFAVRLCWCKRIGEEFSLQQNLKKNFQPTTVSWCKRIAVRSDLSSIWQR